MTLETVAKIVIVSFSILLIIISNRNFQNWVKNIITGWVNTQINNQKKTIVKYQNKVAELVVKCGDLKRENKEQMKLISTLSRNYAEFMVLVKYYNRIKDELEDWIYTMAIYPYGENDKEFLKQFDEFNAYFSKAFPEEIEQ